MTRWFHSSTGSDVLHTDPNHYAPRSAYSLAYAPVTSLETAQHSSGQVSYESTPASAAERTPAQVCDDRSQDTAAYSPEVPVDQSERAEPVSGPYSVTLPHDLQLRPYQGRVWDYMMQDKPGLRAVTIWPRRNGKDLIALNILLAKAIQKTGLYLYLGPLHTQTRQIVWLGSTNDGRKFLDYIPRQLIKPNGVRNSQMEIDLINGSMIKVVGSDQYDSLMGLNALGAVFTEYSLQRPEAWEYIRPMMAANGGWALFNGTPRGLNHFYTLYRMAEQNPDWFCEWLTRDDTGVPTVEAIQEERLAGMKESLIEQEFYCSWTASSESVFIPLDVVAPTIKPTALLDPRAYVHEPKILGCDVAYSLKGDKAVIAFRQGRKVHAVRWYQGLDNMAFAQEIGRFIKEYKPHAVFVDAGRGEGVISRLEQLGYGHLVRGVHFGGKVYEEGYANMKALMWSRMAAWFANVNQPDMTDLDIAPHSNEPVEEQLVTELTTPMQLIDEKNQVAVESKKSLKQRGISSPDLAEALALTFAEELEADDLVPDALIEAGLTPEIVQQIMQQEYEEEYDPLSYMEKLTA